MKHSEQRRFTETIRQDAIHYANEANVRLDKVYIIVTNRDFQLHIVADFASGYTATYSDIIKQKEAWVYWLHDGGRQKWERWLDKHEVITAMEMVMLRRWDLS